MTTTTMHFGPEWMRKAPSRANPSPPLATPATTGASTYSALVTPATQPPPERHDLANPFRYSKEEFIRIYKEGGGKSGLGLEVERWEGIVREVGSDPIGLKEMSEAEKKIFAGSLNSEMRRRPSTDYLSLSTGTLGERPKLGHNTSAGPGSPMRERLGGFMGRRRGDSTDQPPLTIPRKLSQSSLQPPLASPRDALPSPRRMGSGFDGVLSDSWSSRRRASEGLLKGNGRHGEGGDPQDGSKAAGIKEEEEEVGATQLEPADSSGGIHDTRVDQVSHNPHVHGSGLGQTASNIISSGVSNLSLDPATQNAGNSPLVPPNMANISPGPPPGLPDPSTMEWSYLDPQGQIQGPFPAPTMQKWYEDGYFTPNLLMKRANIDTEWTSVGELLQRAGNPRPFLTPLAPALPPPPPSALPRRDPLLDGPVQDGSFGSPFQPVPTRSLRTSALDSYLHNGSLVPDSPSSSFSVGRFSNDSPDPNAFGSRLGNVYNGSPVGSRLGFAGVQNNGIDPQRRSTFDTIDPILSRQGYPGFVQRSGSTDGLGYTDTFSPAPVNPYITSNTVQASFTEKSDDFNNGHGFAVNQLQPSPHSSFVGPDLSSGIREGPRLLKRELFERTDPQPGIQGQLPNGSIGYPAGQPFAQAQPIPYAIPQDARPVQQVPLTPDRPSVAGLAHHTGFGSPQSHSPWPAQEGLAPRRPGPFDPNYPTSRNTVLVKPAVPVQQTVVSQTQPAPGQPKQSPWFTTSQRATGDGWGADPTSLTAANLGQHNKQHEKERHNHQQKQTQEKVDSPTVDHPVQPEPALQPQVEPEPVASTAEAATPAGKSRRKQATPAAVPTPVQPPVKALAAHETTSSPKPPSPVAGAAESKSAWSIEEEKKPLSLREIQELELKKAEARKAAERERERAARAVAVSTPSLPEDVQTISWGLPTSQVGGRATKEVATSSSPSATTPGAPASAPVWTNAAKAPVVKKTMKEIQEEEEKRKKQAVKERETVAATVAAAARRAYTDTTTRATPPVQTGGAWTTVGASGKANTATAPVRPAISTAPPVTKPASAVSTPTLTAASIAARSPAVTTPTRSPVVTAAIKLAPPAPKDETPAPPSHEFLKWMADALKGLNSTVNLEEITSMLLTFPLDPDSSTVEVISDLIYSNSTTLDGRRFAAEFVSKRKADSKGSSSHATSGKPLSIADVVKTQPKPVQNEWGGFKVVNKKKKGARA
ncbi:hypothetical protein BDY19DRAFT_942078 [Irpex rosettiformis]|uniref:Uncharacterized protein n=1 Tax=Irpex rosettiformis TaxID=378272 RepID=A0ACB8U6X6_9APHY|nr:hypothetical protein BDY19DRAFT_942078 [Irpex rosettiformis]